MKKTSRLIFSFIAMTAITLVSYGQAPKQVTIGTQVWMAENLNVDKFRNGDPIPNAKTGEDIRNSLGFDVQPLWYYYNFDPINEEKYGKLYNWAAVNDPRGLAPKGWHIASIKEWTILRDYLGGERIAGQKLKSTSEWTDNDNGTNESGFSALPGGGLDIDGGGLRKKGDQGFWWTSTDVNTSIAGSISMISAWEGVSIHSYGDNKNSFYSVRCIKD
jgi:uncharacterized protein (TIGR02145 family)